MHLWFVFVATKLPPFGEAACGSVEDDTNGIDVSNAMQGLEIFDAGLI